jgi:hypothetical protein
MNIHRGDGIITKSGLRGIATSDPFKATSHFDYWVVRVEFDVCEMPVQLISIVEVWRNGVQVTEQERVVQLPMMFE